MPESKDPHTTRATMQFQGISVMHDKFWVYIVASHSGTLYIGMTNDLALRIRQHKSGEIEGFASKYRCNHLSYFESFDNVLKAIDREKQLKGWRRSKKIALIEKMNPRWEDLAEKWDAEMKFAGEAIGENALKR